MNSVVLSGSKPHLLEHIRLLRHQRHNVETGASYPMRNLPKDSGEYLSALHNIRSLELVNIRIEDIGEEGFRTCFSAFRETLTDLTLALFVISFSAFVGLVGYFHNITTLQMVYFSVIPDERPVPQLSRPLRGKIRLRNIGRNFMEFFNRLANLDLEYEELVLESCSGMETKLLESVLQLSTSAVKHLRLTTDFRGEYPYYASSSLCALTKLLCSRRNGGVNLPLSKAQRVGNNGGFAGFYSRRPSLFNNLHRAPQDYHPNEPHT